DGHVLKGPADHRPGDPELLDVDRKSLRSQASGGYPNVAISPTIVIKDARLARAIANGIASTHHGIVDGAARGQRSTWFCRAGVGPTQEIAGCPNGKAHANQTNSGDPHFWTR